MKLSNVALCLSTVAIAGAASARDQVQIAGSSTVLPYSAIVAEVFGENSDYPTPVVESGGSSAGLKKFCEGVGENTIDIANSSRKIKSSEVEICAEAGVTEIIEVRLGYDGIVFSSDIDGHTFEFTTEDLHKALAAQIVVDGALVDNPYTSWNEINPSFPDQPLALFIPGTKHGTREVFEEKVLLVGCEVNGTIEAHLAAATGDDKEKHDAAESACMKVRTDGVSVDIDGDYTETLASIESNKDGIGVFGLAFYENNTDKLQVAPMEGVFPSAETIASGEYAVSRPLYFYIKKQHIGVIDGLKEFAQFFMAEEVAGPDGPLAAYGLVSDPEIEETQAAIEAEVTM